MTLPEEDAQIARCNNLVVGRESVEHGDHDEVVCGLVSICREGRCERGSQNSVSQGVSSTALGSHSFAGCALWESGMSVSSSRVGMISSGGILS